jgi:hypothetical protein
MDIWNVLTITTVGLVVLSFMYGILTRSAVTSTKPRTAGLAVLALTGVLVAVGTSIWFSPLFEPGWLQYALLIGVPFAIGYVTHRLAPSPDSRRQTRLATHQPESRSTAVTARRIALVVLAVATGGAWIFLDLEFAWVKTMLLALTLGFAFLSAGDWDDRSDVEADRGGDR